MTNLGNYYHQQDRFFFLPWILKIQFQRKKILNFLEIIILELFVGFNDSVKMYVLESF